MVDYMIIVGGLLSLIYAGIAQPEERQSPKLDVVGSIPSARARCQKFGLFDTSFHPVAECC